MWYCILYPCFCCFVSFILPKLIYESFQKTNDAQDRKTSIETSWFWNISLHLKFTCIRLGTGQVFPDQTGPAGLTFSTGPDRPVTGRSILVIRPAKNRSVLWYNPTWHENIDVSFSRYRWHKLNTMLYKFQYGNYSVLKLYNGLKSTYFRLYILLLS